MAMYDYLINAPAPSVLFTIAQINPSPFYNYENFHPFVFQNNIVIFFSQTYSTPLSCIGYVCIDKNGNWIYITSNVFNIENFVYSEIIPVSNGFLLRLNNGQVLFVSPIINYKPNNKNPIRLNFNPTNITVCGQNLTNAVSVLGGTFFWQAVPNSQNGGFIYTQFINKNGSFGSGGIQGTYENSNQTFITNQISNVQYLSNGSASAINYNSTGNFFEILSVFSSYQQGFSSCGPLPPNFPFPGNFSGANVTFFSNNFYLTPYPIFSGYVDSDIFGLVGAVDNSDNNNVFLTFNDGTSYLVVFPSVSIEYGIIVNNFLYLADPYGTLYALTPLSIAPNSKFNSPSYYPLQNLRHSASLPFYQPKKVKP